MKSIILSQQTLIDALASTLQHNAFVHVPASVYTHGIDNRDLLALQASYFQLPPDDRGGNRFRAYKAFQICQGNIKSLSETNYSQSTEYNSDLGGIIRHLPPISEKILDLTLVNKMIQTDLEIALATDFIQTECRLQIGLHQVRYCPLKGQISFSSPPGLHKDEEDIVFVHIVNVSQNLLGGENVICLNASPKATFSNGPPFMAHLNLVDPLEALCVSRLHYHQVSPMSVLFGTYAYRDVLLVTFQNDSSRPRNE